MYGNVCMWATPLGNGVNGGLGAVLHVYYIIILFVRAGAGVVTRTPEPSPLFRTLPHTPFPNA